MTYQIEAIQMTLGDFESHLGLPTASHFKM